VDDDLTGAIRATAAGLEEGHACDVVITKEAPSCWIDR
jgi:hypothetical protein